MKVIYCKTSGKILAVVGDQDGIFIGHRYISIASQNRRIHTQSENIDVLSIVGELPEEPLNESKWLFQNGEFVQNPNWIEYIDPFA